MKRLRKCGLRCLQQRRWLWQCRLRIRPSVADWQREQQRRVERRSAIQGKYYTTFCLGISCFLLFLVCINCQLNPTSRKSITSSSPMLPHPPLPPASPCYSQNRLNPNVCRCLSFAGCPPSLVCALSFSKQMSDETKLVQYCQHLHDSRIQIHTPDAKHTSPPLLTPVSIGDMLMSHTMII